MASSKGGELSYTYWHGKGGGDAPVVAPQVWQLQLCTARVSASGSPVLTAVG